MPTVAIIGAGVAGLVTGKVLQDDGFDVTIFTRDKTAGGTWAAERIYPHLKINSVHGEYRFSSLPMPPPENAKETGGRLTGNDVRLYMEAYASAYLDGKIIFQTEVLNVSRKESGGWSLRTKSYQTNEEKLLQFDKLVLCTGGLSNPYIPPELADKQHKFAGPVKHSALFQSSIPEVLRATELPSETGKYGTVVVVGGGRSAQDISSYYALQGRPVKLVFEKPDTFLAGPSPLPNFLRKSRFLSVLQGHMELRTKLERFLHQTWLGGKIIHGVLHFFRGIALSTFSIPKDSPFRDAHSPFWSLRVNDEGVPHPDSFYSLLKEGKIDVVAPARVTGFGEDGHSVLLSTGERLEAAAVMLASGYQSSWKNIVDEAQYLDLGLNQQAPTGTYHWNYPSLTQSTPPPAKKEQRYALIYRGLVPAKTIDRRDFAINGGIFTTNPPHLFEVSAHWISTYFLSDPFLRIPSPEKALEETKKTVAWHRQRYPDALSLANESYSTSLAYWDWPQTVDTLLEDMGLPTMRAGRNFFTWAFKVIDMDQIASVGDERRQKRLQESG